MTRYLAFAALLLVLAGLVWTLWPRPAVQNPDGFSLQGLLGGDAEGFARAETVRPFRFPADHGAHPDYRSEWWYLTGNLYAADGRRFGFQFTLFRFALSPQPRPGESEWGSRQAWMAHLTVTDVASNRIYAFERFSRGAPGLAGAEAEPFRAWLDDWQLAAVGDPFPWQLLAAEGDIGLRLQLEARKPPVLQGEQGLSRKGPEPGNASYYYSYTRLVAAGELRIGDERLQVTGSAWLDREWSTSVLSEEVQGWDWFALQFTDGSELMAYRLRDVAGTVVGYSAGSYVPANGAPQSLAGADFRLEPVSHWTSPHTGTRYPVRWRLRIPALAAELDIAAATADQELDLSVRYWEGAVDVSGRLGGGSAQGVGYMELTGYGAAGGGRGR